MDNGVPTMSDDQWLLFHRAFDAAMELWDVSELRELPQCLRQCAAQCGIEQDNIPTFVRWGYDMLFGGLQ
jgi:hypothetical protein